MTVAPPPRLSLHGSHFNEAALAHAPSHARLRDRHSQHRRHRAHHGDGTDRSNSRPWRRWCPAVVRAVLGSNVRVVSAPAAMLLTRTAGGFQRLSDPRENGVAMAVAVKVVAQPVVIGGMPLTRSLTSSPPRSLAERQCVHQGHTLVLEALGCDEGGQVRRAAGVAPLVVVPAQHLDHVPANDHGRQAVEDAA